MIKLFAYIGAFFAFIVTANAQGFTGIALYKVCTDSNADSVCIAYIRGFSEGYYQGLYYGANIERAHRRPCYPQPPNENTPDPVQAQLIVKKFMKDHPEKLDEPALFIVQQALGNAFNCPK